MQIIAGSNGMRLAKYLAQEHSLEILDYNHMKYPDSELKVQIKGKIATKVAIVQSTSRPVNDSIMELLLLADALKRAGCKEIIAIVPYFGYGRQVQLTHSNSSIASSLVIKMIEMSSVNRLITLDLHNKSIEGVFNIPVNNIGVEKIFFSKLVENKNSVIVSPDIGSIERCRQCAKISGSSIAIVNKYRQKDDQCVTDGLVGDVKGKNCTIIDDIVDSGNTLRLAADLLKKQGATTVEAFITHGVFSDDSAKNINDSSLDKIYVSDSININSKRFKNLSVVSSNPAISEEFVKYI